MSTRNFQVFPVFGHGATGNHNALLIQQFGDLLVSQGVGGVLIVINFLTLRFAISRGISEPAGP